MRNSRSYFFAVKTAIFIRHDVNSNLRFTAESQNCETNLWQAMRQYSRDPEKCWGLRPAVERDIPRSQDHTASITTFQDFFAAVDAVWDALMFYEEIAQDRPFLLRRFLPTPIGTQGCKSEVGADVKCRYVGGYLLKRVTRIVRRQNYAFEIVEQNLALGGIRLLGGEYTLRVASDDCTRVALATHYASPNCPRWLFCRLEATICHSFHHYILSAMRNNISAR